MAVALERVARLGDLFEPVLGGGQSLAPALRTLQAASDEREGGAAP